MNFKHILKEIAALSVAIFSFSACSELLEGQLTDDALVVEPSSAITFEAKGNAAVVLKVITNVEDWTFTAPDWIEGVKAESSLTLKAKDNPDTKTRLDRLEINAGKAEPVKITLKQLAADEETVDPVDPVEPAVGPAATLVASTDRFYAFNKEGKVTMKVKMTVETAAAEEMKAQIVIDGEYLEEYKYLTKRPCQLLPEKLVDLGEAVLTIPAGSNESDELEIVCSTPEGMQFGVGQLLPIMAKPMGEFHFPSKVSRANFYIVKQNTKSIKNVVYYEVNDTNPLNTLEYVLEDGTPFIDAVILFAANIKYNSSDKVVYLHCNKNVQALLNDTDIFLQPLRERGIKVYLGLLGDHDEAGLCNLSDWGAAQWAKEVAEACRMYKLDGVNLDDEYGVEKTPYNKDWFTKNDQQAGSRLCYELKKAMAKACDWPTEVSYFAWGNLWGANAVVDNETGILHQPKDFIDFYCANYNAPSCEPYGGLTRQNCSAVSIECNLNLGAINEETARRYKEDGYGWVMWFAFDPAPGSHINNGTGTYNLFNRASKGMYGQEVKKPTGYYKKTGPGEFDATLYPFQ